MDLVITTFKDQNGKNRKIGISAEFICTIRELKRGVCLIGLANDEAIEVTDDFDNLISVAGYQSIDPESGEGSEAQSQPTRAVPLPEKSTELAPVISLRRLPNS